MSECEICGSDVGVHTHHIDGDQTNNSEENLIKLCTSHHKKVHGSESMNKYQEEKTIELKEKLPETTETPVECHSCGHEWETESVREKATCPSCLGKTPVNRSESDD